MGKQMVVMWVVQWVAGLVVPKAVDWVGWKVALTAIPLVVKWATPRAVN